MFRTCALCRPEVEACAANARWSNINQLIDRIEFELPSAPHWARNYKKQAGDQSLFMIVSNRELLACWWHGFLETSRKIVTISLTHGDSIFRTGSQKLAGRQKLICFVCSLGY